MTLPLPDPLIVVPRGRIGDDVADPEGVQRNFQALAARFPLQPQDLAEGVLKLAVAGTKRSVAMGNTTLTWGGASPAASASVTHNLGVTPVVVLVSAVGTSGGFAVAAYITSLPSTTAASVAAYAQGGTPANGDTAALYWLAIG